MLRKKIENTAKTLISKSNQSFFLLQICETCKIY